MGRLVIILGTYGWVIVGVDARGWLCCDGTLHQYFPSSRVSGVGLAGYLHYCTRARSTMTLPIIQLQNEDATRWLAMQKDEATG